MAGINGGAAISVFSSDLPGTFFVARAIPATATLIKEPPVSTSSRKSEDQIAYKQSPRLGPIIDIGSKLDATKYKLIFGGFQLTSNINYRSKTRIMVVCNLIF